MNAYVCLLFTYVDACESVSTRESVCMCVTELDWLDPQRRYSFLEPGEEILHMGLIIKKRKWTSKKRNLILTNAPRLLVRAEYLVVS